MENEGQTPEVVTEGAAPAAPALPQPAGKYYGTGRRKESVARVFLRPGSGKFFINRRPFDEFFKTVRWRVVAREPLTATATAELFDVMATVTGGGSSGQAGALRLGIARALVTYHGELRSQLKKKGLLSRDPRMKERKKYGQKGARKRFQYSKR